jgi:sorting nexin-1/2
MSDNALQGSEWDDAVSSNPARFGPPDTVVDGLASTLAKSDMRDQEDEEGEKGEKAEEAENDEEGEEINYRQEEILNAVKEDKEEQKPEPKDTSGLLSTLTEGADKGFISETLASPKKDEALFKDIRASLKIDDGSNGVEDEHKDESIKSATGSPTRVRRHNIYKAPRLRRSQLKQGNGPNEEHDPLGPLGGSEDQTLTSQDDESPAERLFKQAEQPLFEINRTPLSPLKKIQPKESSENAIESQSEQHEQHEQHDKRPEKDLALKMKISVGDPIKVGELTGAHIVYSVRTKCESEAFPQGQAMVSRRYRDFRWLYRQLQSTHPGRIVPPPPEKQAMGRFNDDFIEARRFALERMLVKISESPVLQQDSDFLMFLQSERFASEAREREKAVGTMSVFTEHESDSLNNSSGGFLSSIGGAFSFTPKIVEPDEYFKDKKSYIEGLSQQYKAFSRNLEIIIIQRQDLASITEEFANIVLTLADLEISKNATEIFQEFSATQTRIKELLDRLSLQDMLTLGATLDEYMRIINSIKTVFQQRDKILVQLSNSESEYKKKQASLDKYVKYNRTLTDKIEVLKSELQGLEQKHKTARERFENISGTIKEELAAFEVEKIHDFRNSIEIFLESTIESQKEAVELWETFYNLHLSA